MVIKMAKLPALAAALALVFLTTPATRAADTDPAARQIQTFYAALLDTMKHGHELGVHGRYQAMAPAVDAAFDIPTMIRFIVGPSWASMADTDHKALIDAFRRMTIANYATNFDDFHGEQFTVDPNVQSRGPDDIVQTTLVPSDGGKPVPLIYRMRATNGSWKIIDVFLNGYVSELAMRRSDFASTLASGGAAALAKHLNALADNLLAGGKNGGG
jgi:phospholipid transport system substrate-binding protein